MLTIKSYNFFPLWHYFLFIWIHTERIRLCGYLLYGTCVYVSLSALSWNQISSLLQSVSIKNTLQERWFACFVTYTDTKNINTIFWKSFRTVLEFRSDEDDWQRRRGAFYLWLGSFDGRKVNFFPLLLLLLLFFFLVWNKREILLYTKYFCERSVFLFDVSCFVFGLWCHVNNLRT